MGEVLEIDTPHERVGVIIVAAGKSQRMDHGDKIFAPLMGRPLISYSVDAFHRAPEVQSIVLVLSADNIEAGRLLVANSGWERVREVCVGGQRRQDSVRCGLDRLTDQDWVLVHDGARPLVDPELVSIGLSRAMHGGAAIAAVPVIDTIKSADAELRVTETLDRDRLWATQTPQIFRRQLLEEAHARVTEDVTDDAAMVERIGGEVRIFTGSYHNIKITTAADLSIAAGILRGRAATESWRGQ